MKKLKIFFIYADGCEHCQDALQAINNSINYVKDVDCEIVKYHYETQVAISIAINKGIDGLPGFVIGDDVYIGDDYTEKDIIESIVKAKLST